MHGKITSKAWLINRLLKENSGEHNKSYCEQAHNCKKN